MRELRDILLRAKARPCTDCKKQFPPYVTEFDHVRFPKRCHVSRMVYHGVPARVLLAEIAKCELVCACCHRIREFSRGRLRMTRQNLRLRCFPCNRCNVILLPVAMDLVHNTVVCANCNRIRNHDSRRNLP